MERWAVASFAAGTIPARSPASLIATAAHRGRIVLHKGGKPWRDYLAEGADRALYDAGLRGVPLATPLIIRIDCAYRTGGEATDPNNRCTLTYDAIQAATGINDRHMPPETGTVRYGMAIPAIGITVRMAPRPGASGALSRAPGGGGGPR